MNRPSHWILALFAVIGPALWVWGLSAGFPETTGPLAGSPQQTVATRLRNSPPPAPVPQGVLVGRVTDNNGAPLESATIRILHPRDVLAPATGRGAAVTRQGAFEVPVQLAEPYLRVEVAAHGFVPVVARCAASDITGFVAALQPAVPFAPSPGLPTPAKRPPLVGNGFVFDHDRRPVAGAVVTVLETGDSTFTDEGGTYKVPIPPKNATLAIWHEDGRASQTETFSYANSDGMVGLGETLLQPGVRVRGAVVHPDGSPAAEAAVLLRHRGLERRAITAADGSFEVAGLIAVDYEAEVLPLEGCVSLRCTLDVNGSGLLQSELRLEAEKPLRVRILDEEGAARPQAFVVAHDDGQRRSWAQADAQGFATLRGLGAGEITWDEVRSAQHAPLELVKVLSKDGVPHLVTRL